MRKIIIPRMISIRNGERLINMGKNKKKRLKELGTYMMPGPSRVLTSFKSLVNLEIRSPVSFF